MKKQKMLFGVVAVLLCFLLISGCFQQTSTSKTSIRDILAKAKTIGPVKYDVIITPMINGNYTANRTMTIWEEPPYMKVNMSMGPSYKIFITRPNGTYVNISGPQKFIKTDLAFPETSLIAQSDALRSNITFRVVGNVTIDGNAATVLQYTTNRSGDLITTKVWIWNEKGIPLQTEITVVMGKRTFASKTVNKNFVFGDIPLSEFSV
jgi:outer membrane lipoprotein-sorting protein